MQITDLKCEIFYSLFKMKMKKDTLIGIEYLD